SVLFVVLKEYIRHDRVAHIYSEYFHDFLTAAGADIYIYALYVELCVSLALCHEVRGLGCGYALDELALAVSDVYRVSGDIACHPAAEADKGYEAVGLDVLND